MREDEMMIKTFVSISQIVIKMFPNRKFTSVPMTS